MSSGQCKRCQNIKAGLGAAKAELLGVLRRAESRPSAAKLIPAAQDRVNLQKSLLQHHEHDEHGGDKPDAAAVLPKDATPDHGTYLSYTRNKCRCVECMDANAARSREYYHQSKATAGASK